MRTWLRIFFIGGVIAYRGLFNWISPAYYMLVGMRSALIEGTSVGGLLVPNIVPLLLTGVVTIPAFSSR